MSIKKLTKTSYVEDSGECYLLCWKNTWIKVYILCDQSQNCLKNMILKCKVAVISSLWWRDLRQTYTVVLLLPSPSQTRILSLWNNRFFVRKKKKKTTYESQTKYLDYSILHWTKVVGAMLCREKSQKLLMQWLTAYRFQSRNGPSERCGPNTSDSHFLARYMDHSKGTCCLNRP